MSPTTTQIETLRGMLADRRIELEYLESKEAALERIKDLIPPEASVMTGGSKTLEQVGFTRYLEAGEHPWTNLKGQINQEDVEACRKLLRRQASLADFYVGGVNAIAETGQLVWGSGSGSQLSAYAYTARNCLWVAGSNKLVPDLPAALDRLHSEVVPIYVQNASFDVSVEDAVGKILIFEREKSTDRSLHLLLIDEPLGF